MIKELFAGGVHLIDCDTRVEGLQSAFGWAEVALNERRYDSVSIVSPHRHLTLGCDLGKTACSISFLSTSDARLNEWSFDWQTMKDAYENLRLECRAQHMTISLADAIGHASWYDDKLLMKMYERKNSTLNIWDIGDGEGVFLPCIDGEAKRRGVCVFVVKSTANKLALDGEDLPNLKIISIYERCLALIRAEGKISESLIQRTFDVLWEDARQLTSRLNKEGIIKEVSNGPFPYEIIWKNVPRGPILV